MSRIPILALPGFAVIIVVVLLLVFDPGHTQESTTPTVTVETTATPTPVRKKCWITQSENTTIIEC